MYAPFTSAQSALALWEARVCVLTCERDQVRALIAEVSALEWVFVDSGARDAARALGNAALVAWDKVIRLETTLAVAQAHVKRLTARVADEEKGIRWDDPVAFPPAI